MASADGSLRAEQVDLYLGFMKFCFKTQFKLQSTAEDIKDVLYCGPVQKSVDLPTKEGVGLFMDQVNCNVISEPLTIGKLCSRFIYQYD